MIIEGLLSVIFNLLNAVISIFDVPQAPDEFINAVPEFLDLLYLADGLFSFVFPIKIMSFFTISLIIMAVEHGYPFIMWVLRKIPFLGIE